MLHDSITQLNEVIDTFIKKYKIQKEELKKIKEENKELKLYIDHIQEKNQKLKPKITELINKINEKLKQEK